MSNVNIDIIVPSLGESVSEATITKWNKKIGDKIVVDELLLELETEKVNLEINSPVNGVLTAVLKSIGDTVAVGTIVGKINESFVDKKQNDKVIIDNMYVHATHSLDTTVDIKAADVSSLSPATHDITKEDDLNPVDIKIPGHDGYVTREDSINTTTTGYSKLLQPSQLSIMDGTRIERVRMSKLRKTIAQRLKNAQNAAAILTTFNEVDMSNVIALRQQYGADFEKKHGIKLGFMSFFVKATVVALKEMPSINAEIDGDDILYKNYYDIGVAVGTEQGLVVPVVRNCNILSFAEIEQEIFNLSNKARTGKLSMTDLSGGTFSISNGGVYGSLLSTPIINPPQSGILGLHKIQERAVVVASKIEIRHMMYIALSYDHRIIDGKEAVTFLTKIKTTVENPERSLFEL